MDAWNRDVEKGESEQADDNHGKEYGENRERPALREICECGFDAGERVLASPRIKEREHAKNESETKGDGEEVQRAENCGVVEANHERGIVGCFWGVDGANFCGLAG